jgi:hypothetical protein
MKRKRKKKKKKKKEEEGEEKEKEEEKTKEDGEEDVGKSWAAKLFSTPREAWKFFSLTPHLEETTKKNRRKFPPSNSRHREKFEGCFLAKKEINVNELKEEEKEKEVDFNKIFFAKIKIEGVGRASFGAKRSLANLFYGNHITKMRKRKRRKKEDDCREKRKGRKKKKMNRKKKKKKVVFGKLSR